VLIVQCLNRLSIRNKKDFHQITDAREKAGYGPGQEGKVKQKQLLFKAIRHLFGTADAIQGTVFRMIQQEVNRETVAVYCDYPGNQE
jgi:hypothetical protein